MIPSDTTLCALQADSYSAVPQGEVIDAAEDRAVIRRFPGCTVVTIRGTVNQAGWWSDFQIAPKVAREHPQLGVCEDGFLTGAEALWPLVRVRLGTTPPTPTIVQGHSRGAGMAPILAGLMVVDGIPPVRCVPWEKPWSGGPVLRALLEQAGVEGAEYWHGDDPVPLVPAVSWLVLNFFPIVHFGRWMVDPFACHGIAGILADVQAGAIG